jgi:hypothetical protein
LEDEEAKGLLRPTVFKILTRLGIEATPQRGEGENRGQFISLTSKNKADRILNQLGSAIRVTELGKPHNLFPKSANLENEE